MNGSTHRAYVRTSSIIAVYAATAPPEECPEDKYEHEHGSNQMQVSVRTYVYGHQDQQQDKNVDRQIDR